MNAEEEEEQRKGCGGHMGDGNICVLVDRHGGIEPDNDSTLRKESVGVQCERCEREESRLERKAA